MSFPGTPPTESSSDSDIPLWTIFVAIAVMLVGAGLAAYVLLTQEGDESDGRSYPDAWDPRIAPYVQVVEKQRGLSFMHPVPVRFLPAKEFKETVTADKSKLDKEQREQIDQFTGLFRALGLLAGDVDLFDAFNDAHGSGTLAYYSPEDEEVVIRGEKVTVASRAVVVHELTHVLQDQHFAIGDRLDRLRRANEKTTSTEYDVFDAIVEGDAERIATRYRESLPERQRRALARSEEKQREDIFTEYEKVPKVVLTMMSSPYTLGEAMVQTAAANGGNTAVDKLFRDPPKHDSVLLDPLPGLAGKDSTTREHAVELGDGEDEFVSGEFGALGIYFMLAERTSVLDALSAVDAWDGDAFVGFRREDTTCARAAVHGATTQGTGRLFDAFRRWAAGSPGSSAHVQRDGALVRFESCDPGTTARAGRDASIDALTVVSIRSQLGAEFVKQGLPSGAARCIADTAVHEFPMSTLTAARLGAADTERLRQIAASCR